MIRGLALPAWAPAVIVAALASAAVHLWAERRQARAVVHVAKPLTTALLVALAVTLPARDPAYRVVVVIGLVASLAGDVFLMLPGDRFVAGLASFLVAHLAYLAAFTRAAPLFAAPTALALYAVVGAALVVVLWPRLGVLRVPVLAYAAALVAMAAQAAAHARVVDGSPARLAAVGAALFVASDAILAVDRFRAPVPHAQDWIMTTYVAAQLGIALSVLPGA